MSYRPLGTTFASTVTLAVLLVFGCGGRKVPPPDVESGTTTTLQIVVEGVRNQNGHLMLALFDSKDGFPNDSTKAVRHTRKPIEGSSVRFVIEELPAGVYAASILHDENDDAEMATNFWGAPAEGYAFSMDAKGFMGPPGFDDAAFAVGADTLTHFVKMRY